MKMQVEVEVSFEKPHGWACFRKEIDAPLLPPGSTLFVGELDIDIDKYYWEEKTGALLVAAQEQIKSDDPIDDFIAWMGESGRLILRVREAAVEAAQGVVAKETRGGV